VPKGVGVRLVTQMTEGDPQWIIRLEEKNGSRCLSVGTDGTLGLARCAPSDARQRFQLMRGPTDEYWRVPTYRIVGVDRPPGALVDLGPGRRASGHDRRDERRPRHRLGLRRRGTGGEIPGVGDLGTAAGAASEVRSKPRWKSAVADWLPCRGERSSTVVWMS